MTKDAILIVGMDRSGTSALAAVSQIVGLHLGDRLIGPRPANPKGYFEDSRCVNINKELLANLRHPEFSVGPLPRGWIDGLPAKYAATRAAGVIRRLSRGKPLGIKDPRLCLTAPLWIRELQARDFETRAIICFRNPLEVAASLHARDGRPHVVSCLVWLFHTVSALDATRDLPRVFVEHARLMRDPVGVGREMSAFITGDGALSPGQEAGIVDFVEPGLWQNRLPLSAGNDVEKAAIDVFRHLKDAPEGGKEDHQIVGLFRSLKENLEESLEYAMNLQVRSRDNQP